MNCPKFADCSKVKALQDKDYPDLVFAQQVKDTCEGCKELKGKK